MQIQCQIITDIPGCVGKQRVVVQGITVAAGITKIKETGACRSTAHQHTKGVIVFALDIRLPLGGRRTIRVWAVCSCAGVFTCGIAVWHHPVTRCIRRVVHPRLRQIGAFIPAESCVGFELAGQHHIKVANRATPKCLHGVIFKGSVRILFGVSLNLEAIVRCIGHKIDHARNRLTAVQCCCTIRHNINTGNGDSRQQQIDVCLCNTFSVYQHQR